MMQVTNRRIKARAVIPIPSRTNSNTIAPIKLAITVATAYAINPAIGTPPRTVNVARATNLIGFEMANRVSFFVRSPMVSPFEVQSELQQNRSENSAS